MPRVESSYKDQRTGSRWSSLTFYFLLRTINTLNNTGPTDGPLHPRKRVGPTRVLSALSLRHCFIHDKGPTPQCGFVLLIFYEGLYPKLLENTSEFCLPGHLYYFRIFDEEITALNMANEYLRLGAHLDTQVQLGES